MKPTINSALPASVHHFEELHGVKIPIPALQRGWLHSRRFTQSWRIAGIIDKIGDRCWFSRYLHDRDSGYGNPAFYPDCIGGLWPSGGFIELDIGNFNPLEDHQRACLDVYAESSGKAEALMAELIVDYAHEATPSTPQPRIGILNQGRYGLEVERIPVTASQAVSRDQLDLYYGDGMALWVNEWIGALNSRRYGLTLLTGAPGTGKTTLLRSLAHWLAASHVFYFMPAARFPSVESGEIVTFLARDNRQSMLRKVLILEDAESVLQRREDSNREKVATLLNLTDGMLGDALGLHVICTLNSELTDLDPALLRPGRLVAHRNFCLLTTEEAGRLARALGFKTPAGAHVSLAEIFNPPPDRSVNPQVSRRVMGFHTVLSAGAA